MNIYIELLLISNILVFVIDVSGFVKSAKRFISKQLVGIPSSDFPAKPFDCSLCMTFWIGIIYTISIEQFSIPVLSYICLLSLLSEIFKQAQYLLKDTFGYILNGIDNVVNRLQN